ncbi:MAG: aminotransferase class IV [Methylocystaceae bacterium]|nr:aminotransferase class IV [Methylocystaceae bacterium]
MIAWFNGDLLPLGGINIAATDRGFLLGDGFFETMAAQNGHIVRFKDHMERLNLTSQKLNLPLPYSHEEIEQAIKDILLASQLTTCRAAIRLTITRGSGPRGLMPPLEITPNVLISASEAPENYSAAIVKTVRSVRRNEFSPTSTIKSLCYMDNIFAIQEAKEAGADEALLLNTSGHIAEGTVSNIFFIEGDTLLTPQVSDGALPGTVRKATLDCARQLGLKVVEKSLSPDIIQSCDEAFLTNSLYRVRAIYEIDGRLMPQDVWTHKLLSALKAQET